MSRPVVVIGLDAADHTLLQQWADQGLLPTLAALLQGPTARTDPPDGFFVGSIWPTFATGQGPGRHGVHNWKQVQIGRYGDHVVHARDIMRSPTLWDAASAAGARVAVLDVPLSPEAPEVNGLQVLEWGNHDAELGLLTTPAELAVEITERFGTHPVAEPCNTWDRSESDFARLRDALAQGAAARADLLQWVWGKERWDLFIAVFSESHCAGHQTWHLHDPTHPHHDPAMASRIGDPVLSTYQAIDTALGRLLAEVGDEAEVLVWASHGMGGHYDPTVLVDRVLLKLDAAYERHLARRPRARLGALDPRRRRDRARRLALLDSDDPAGVPPEERRFLPQANNHVDAGVRLNLTGREPAGRIAPGPEAEAAAAWLTARLHRLDDADTGAPVVRRVLRTRDLYTGPHVDALPDLVVQWNREGWVRAVRSEDVGTLDGGYPGPRSGDHDPAGLLMLRGPDTAADADLPAVAVQDLAPTVAALLGAEMPEAEGRPRMDVIGALRSGTTARVP